MSGNARQCTATSKRTGERCKANAMKGKDVCRHHGGKSKVGAGVSTYRDGRYSRYLPERLAAKYEEASNDTELLSLREDVALLDARLAELVGRLDTGETVQSWLLLSGLWSAYREGDVEESAGAERRIGELIEHGLSEGSMWGEINALLDSRRKLVEGERKRLVDMQQMVTAERAMAFVVAVVAAVKNHVRDPEALAAVSADIARLVHQDAAGGGRGPVVGAGAR